MRSRATRVAASLAVFGHLVACGGGSSDRATSDFVVVEAGDDSALALPGNDGTVESTTIELEITPQSIPAGPDTQTLLSASTEDGIHLRLLKEGAYLRFVLTDSNGMESDIAYRLDGWHPGSSYSVTATYGNGDAMLYVNGQPVGAATYTGQFIIPPGTPLYIGSASADARLRVRVSDRALGDH